jgi:hypothetical protein
MAQLRLCRSSLGLLMRSFFAGEIGELHDHFLAP